MSGQDGELDSSFRSASFLLVTLAHAEEDLSRSVKAFLTDNCPVGNVAVAAKGKLVLGGPALFFEGLCDRLADLGHRAGEEIRTAIRNYHRDAFSLSLPSGRLDLSGRAKIMGIVNVTPDSFSDGGEHATTESAVAHAQRLVEAGADIIDVGGESTRPGAETVPEGEELRRVIPVIERLRQKSQVPISVDTSKWRVAAEALDAGASLLNDVTAMRADERMGRLAAERGASLILMHMQGEPRTMQQNPRYADIMEEIAEFLCARIDAAVAAGVPKTQIVIDPGFGFGKTVEHNLEILRRLPELRSLGQPLMVGTSRKSTIGRITGKPPGQRVVGSVAASVLSMLGGAQIVRVHDVAETAEALAVAQAVRSGSVPDARLA